MTVDQWMIILHSIATCFIIWGLIYGHSRIEKLEERLSWKKRTIRRLNEKINDLENELKKAREKGQQKDDPKN